MKRRNFLKAIAVAQVGAAAGILAVKAGQELYGRPVHLQGRTFKATTWDDVPMEAFPGGKHDDHMEDALLAAYRDGS